MSDIKFKQGRPEIKSGEKDNENPENLTLNQHLIPAVIIERWKTQNRDKNGKDVVGLKVFRRKNNNYIPIEDERNPIFAYKHNWDQLCEQEGTKIENFFHDSTLILSADYKIHPDRIFNLNFQLSCDKYIDLMDFRNACIEEKLKSKDLDVLKNERQISVPDMSAHFFDLSNSPDEEEECFPKTHEQMCKNEKNMSKFGPAHCSQQFIKQENGKYYWPNSFLYFHTNILIKYQYDYSILDIKKKIDEKTYWIFVEHDRVILPDKWKYRFISYSPYQTIMPYITYIDLLPNYYRCLNGNEIKKIIAERLNYIAKQSYRDWYIE